MKLPQIWVNDGQNTDIYKLRHILNRIKVHLQRSEDSRDEEEDEGEELEEVTDRLFVTILGNHATLCEIVKTRHTPLVSIADNLIMW